MTTLTFNNTTLSTITQDNQIWLTASELAKALGYKNTKSVTNLYNSNADEFTSSMTLVIELVTKGFGNGNSKKPTRIFSLRGCHLIAMFSRTKIAKDFRKWVLDILDNEVGQPVQTAQLTSEQTQPLRDAVNVLVTKAGLLYPDAYKMVHRKFGVKHIKNLTVEQASLAVDYVHWLIIKTNSQNASIEADRVNAYALSVHMMHCKNWFDSVREPLEALSPDITSKVKGHFLEGMSAAKQLNRAICEG